MTFYTGGIMNISIKYCKLCGKPFNYKVNVYCSGCLGIIDESFEKCRLYLDKKDDIDISKLSEDTGVPEKIILLLLKEGRLEMEDSLLCERCGRPVISGRLCNECSNSLISELSKTKNNMQRDYNRLTGNERMHTAYKHENDIYRRRKGNEN